MATLWCLNLDAEFELAGQTLAASGRNAQQEFAREAFPFVAPEDLVLGERGVGKQGDPLPDDVQAGLRGRAWCPTPGALARLAAAGVPPEPAPDAETLRRVNHRAFHAALGPGRLEQRLVHGASEAARWLARPGEWLLKRPLSMAGRGKRRVRGGPLSEQDKRWIDATFRRFDALLIEERVSVEYEFALHGWVAADGRSELGQPVLQEVTASGQWRGARPIAGELCDAHAQELLAEGGRVAEALVGAGYFGPFGIDAFTFLRDGEVLFQPRSEINARFTMSWGLAGPEIPW